MIDSLWAAHQRFGLWTVAIPGGPEAVRKTKDLVRHARWQTAEESIANALSIHTEARTSDEAAEGLAAFREHREPNW